MRGLRSRDKRIRIPTGESMKKLLDYWKVQVKKISAGYLPAGSKNGMWSTALKLIESIEATGISFEEKNILDIGCGNGRLAIGLMLGERNPRNYLGLDIIPDCIKFGNEAFAKWPAYKFALLEVNNARYYSKAKNKGVGAAFPVKPGIWDVLICSSLFTHIKNESLIIQYFDQMNTAAQEEAKIFMTFFFEGEDRNEYRTVLNKAWVLKEIEARWKIINSSEKGIEEFGGQVFILAGKH